MSKGTFSDVVAQLLIRCMGKWPVLYIRATKA